MSRGTDHSIQASTVSSPSKVAHPPNGRPQASDVVYAGQGDRHFNIASGETELIPTGHHTALVVELMGLLLGEGDLEGTALCGDGGRVIPLEIAGLPVVKVDSFPVWIVTGVERSTLIVEFVREDQLKLCPVMEGCPGQGPVWSVRVDETSLAWKFRDLKWWLEVLG